MVRCGHPGTRTARRKIFSTLIGCARRERLPGESKSGSVVVGCFIRFQLMTEVECPRVMFPESGKIQNALLPISCRRSPIRRMACGRTRLQALSPAGDRCPLTCPGLVVEDKPVAHDLEFYIIRIGECGVIRFVGGQAGPSIVVQQVRTPRCYRVYGFEFHISRKG